MARRRHISSTLGERDVRDLPVYIYALCEPDTGEVRYIGKSQSPAARLAQLRNKGSWDVLAWFVSLGDRRPRLTILATVEPGQDADAAEREAIEAHDGPRLLNVHVKHRPIDWAKGSRVFHGRPA